MDKEDGWSKQNQDDHDHSLPLQRAPTMHEWSQPILLAEEIAHLTSLQSCTDMPEFPKRVEDDDDDLQSEEIGCFPALQRAPSMPEPPKQAEDNNDLKAEEFDYYFPLPRTTEMPEFPKRVQHDDDETGHYPLQRAPSVPQIQSPKRAEDTHTPPLASGTGAENGTIQYKSNLEDWRRISTAPPPSPSPDNRGHINHSAKLTRLVTSNSSFRGLENTYDVADPHEALASLLDKLLALDKTLSDEVNCKAVLECQACDLYGHLAHECPWLYTKCRIDNCKGIRRLWTSHTHKNPDRKYLACLDDGCLEFQWLDEAISQGPSRRTSSVSTPTGCLNCGNPKHIKSNTPWLDPPCKSESCSGTRVLHTCDELQSVNKPDYFKCNKCGNFQCSSVRTEERKKIGGRLQLDLSLDDFCEVFEKGISLGRKLK